MKSGYYRFLSHYQGSYTKQILDEAINLLGDLWPYLVTGILVTVLIRLYISKQRLSVFLQGNKTFAIPVAALLGLVSPLGSYIIIPLSAALYSTGVSLPVLMALMVSSPLINPNLFILTHGAMGLEMALARVLSAFLLGLLAGYFTQWLVLKNKIGTEFQPVLSDNQILTDEEAVKPTMRIFFKELYKMTRFISKYFFLALLLAAIIKIITPPDLMLEIFKGSNFMSVLLSTSAGVPFYVCGGASIPVVMELANLGLSKGAILSFFISGPITKVANLILMFTIFRKRLFTIYISCGLAGAIILGLIYNLFN